MFRNKYDFIVFLSMWIGIFIFGLTIYIDNLNHKKIFGIFTYIWYFFVILGIIDLILRSTFLLFNF